VQHPAGVAGLSRKAPGAVSASRHAIATVTYSTWQLLRTDSCREAWTTCCQRDQAWQPQSCLCGSARERASVEHLAETVAVSRGLGARSSTRSSALAAQVAADKAADQHRHPHCATYSRGCSCARCYIIHRRPWIIRLSVDAAHDLDWVDVRGVTGGRARSSCPHLARAASRHNSSQCGACLHERRRGVRPEGETCSRTEI